MTHFDAMADLVAEQLTRAGRTLLALEDLRRLHQAAVKRWQPITPAAPSTGQLVLVRSGPYADPEIMCRFLDSGDGTLGWKDSGNDYYDGDTTWTEWMEVPE